MTKEDVALVVLHALMSNPSTDNQSISEVFDIAEVFLQEAEKRGEGDDKP